MIVAVAGVADAGDVPAPVVQRGEAREGAVRVLVLGRIVPRDIVGQIRRKKLVALPDDEMRGVGGVHDVDGMDIARVFLADALRRARGKAQDRRMRPARPGADPGAAGTPQAMRRRARR